MMVKMNHSTIKRSCYPAARPRLVHMPDPEAERRTQPRQIHPTWLRRVSPTKSERGRAAWIRRAECEERTSVMCSVSFTMPHSLVHFHRNDLTVNNPGCASYSICFYQKLHWSYKQRRVTQSCDVFRINKHAEKGSSSTVKDSLCRILKKERRIHNFFFKERKKEKRERKPGRFTN